MECARNVLISAACFRHKAVFRFALLRSDLLCHHGESTIATYRFIKVQSLVQLSWSYADVVRFVTAVMGQYCPGSSCDLVRQSDGCHVGRPSLLNSFLPCCWYLRVTQDRAGSMDQQCAQVGVASLRDGAQSNLAARTGLPRNKAEERSEFTP